MFNSWCPVCLFIRTSERLSLMSDDQTAQVRGHHTAAQMLVFDKNSSVLFSVSLNESLNNSRDYTTLFFRVCVWIFSSGRGTLFNPSLYVLNNVGVIYFYRNHSLLLCILCSIIKHINRQNMFEIV